MDLATANVQVKRQGPNGRPYTTIEVQSKSNPNKRYTVDLVNVRCSCPGWTMHVRPDGSRRVCQHLRDLGYTDEQSTAANAALGKNL
jgi:hypothetical protein